MIWPGLAAAIAVPIVAAISSPLLAWRAPIYIVAGFAGVIALALMLMQPLLAAGLLPGLSGLRGRRFHRWIGGTLVASVVVHVAALWITSPPDMVDALLFVSPTVFSYLGVVAMWALFAKATLAMLRSRMRLRPRSWRVGHTCLAVVIVVCSVGHAILIEGTMGTMSKIALCVLVVAATIKAVAGRRVWANLTLQSQKTPDT